MKTKIVLILVKLKFRKEIEIEFIFKVLKILRQGADIFFILD